MIWNKAAIDLKERLVVLYTKESDYRVIVRESELDEGRITFTGKADTDWSEILTEADKHNKIFDLINTVKKGYPNDKEFYQAAEQYVQSKAEQRDSRSASKALSPEIKVVYNKYLDVLQAKREVAHWYDISTNANDTLADQEGISPENIGQVQQSLHQLNNLVKEEYRLLEKDGDLRNFFGRDCYDLMKLLNSVDEQSSGLITKMPIFRSIYTPNSIIALEWQQDIQQVMMDILQKLQGIDGLVQPLQTQTALLKEGTKVVEVTDVHQLPMHVSTADTTVTSVSEVLFGVDEKKLREAIFRFYKIDKLIDLCSALSKAFADSDLEYEKLSGRNAEAKIQTLLHQISQQGMFERLIQYLMETPGFQDELL